MRSFRIISISVVLVVSLAAPNVFARICQPKKPITCGAATLSPVTAPAAKATVKAAKPQTPKTQQAMICGPWVRWMCAGNSLAVVAAPAEPVKHAPVSQQAMICGPWVRWMCAGNSLVAAPAEPVKHAPATQQAMICGPWVRWMCAGNTLA